MKGRSIDRPNLHELAGELLLGGDASMKGRSIDRPNSDGTVQVDVAADASMKGRSIDRPHRPEAWRVTRGTGLLQ